VSDTDTSTGASGLLALVVLVFTVALNGVVDRTFELLPAAEAVAGNANVRERWPRVSAGASVSREYRRLGVSSPAAPSSFQADASPKCLATSEAMSVIAHWSGSLRSRSIPHNTSGAERVARVQRSMTAHHDMGLAAPIEELISGSSAQHNITGVWRHRSADHTRARASG